MAIAQHHESRGKILASALHAIRSKGYAATTVDDICGEAGVTKGSFFHHFKSKDEMAVGAVEYWNSMTEAFFASAPYQDAADPLERLLGYIDFRNQIIQGDTADFTCLLGTLVQETYGSHEEIRKACEVGMTTHIEKLTLVIESAKAKYASDATWSPTSVAFLIQAVLQGSFILTKATQNPEVIRESLDHIKRYLISLFDGHESTYLELKG